MMNIVLVNPQIPQNTGNIARTCSVTGSTLHLIRPLGFSLDDRYLKRAGLDYWDQLDIQIYDDLDEFLQCCPRERMYLFTTRANSCYHEIEYEGDEYLLFGQETDGLDEDFVSENFLHSLRIPMQDWARSLNLANSVAIVLYEAYRQLDFPGFNRKGDFLKEF